MDPIEPTDIVVLPELGRTIYRSGTWERDIALTTVDVSRLAAEYFRNAWSMLPRHVRRTLLEHWQTLDYEAPGVLMTDLIIGGPKKLVGVASCSTDGGLFQVCNWYVPYLPPVIARAILAHEFGHAYSAAMRYSSSEDEVDALTSLWGFPVALARRWRYEPASRRSFEAVRQGMSFEDACRYIWNVEATCGITSGSAAGRWVPPSCETPHGVGLRRSL